MTVGQLIETLKEFDEFIDAKMAVDFRTDDIETVRINDDGDLVIEGE